jgi:hypothetical protein
MPEIRELPGVIRQQRNILGNNFRNRKKRLLPFPFGVHVLVNNE